MTTLGTGLSRTGFPGVRGMAGFLVLALGTTLSLSCLPTGQPRLITVYVPDIAVSLPLPQGWTSAANQQGGYRMTTFSGPSVDVPERDGIQVQVMAGPAPADQTLREVADRFYIGEQIVLSEEPVRIGSEEGFLWTFEWERRPQSGRLLLIEREGLLYGVFATGEARSVQAYGPTLDRMYEGFSIESADYFDVYEDPEFDLALRYPQSWTRSHFLREPGETLFVGFRSGPLAVDTDGTTVHATLEVTVANAEPGTTLEGFYSAAAESLGENYRMLRHDILDDGRGIAVLYSVETQLADYLEWVIYNLVDGKTYLYRFHCRNTLYRAIEPWLAEIATRFASSAGNVSAGPDN
ncbi:MAG: hypothetical protein OXU35_10140 [Acidobacteriota bacterium]|nr:hypothetical protein [Acidobacteriota bacterium]